MYDRFKAHGSFTLYVGLNALIYPAIWLFVRETKELSLEGLNDLMTIGLREYIHNNLRDSFPRFFSETKRAGPNFGSVHELKDMETQD